MRVRDWPIVVLATAILGAAVFAARRSR